MIDAATVSHVRRTVMIDCYRIACTTYSDDRRCYRIACTTYSDDRRCYRIACTTYSDDRLLPYRMYDAAYVVTRLSELQPTDDNRTYRFPTSTSSCRLCNLYIDAIQHGVYAAIPTSDATTGTTDWMTNTNSCGPIDCNQQSSYTSTHARCR